MKADSRHCRHEEGETDNLTKRVEAVGAGQIAEPNDRHWEFLSRGLLIILALVILTTFLDYGLTFDEEFGKTYGQYVVRWYSSFFRDRSALGYYNLHLYGGFFEAVLQLATSVTKKILPIGVYELRHIFNAFTGLLGVWATYKLGAEVLNRKAGFFAALFLIVTPGFYGQIFNDSKDIPFAAFSSVALFYMFRSYKQLPAVWCGLTVGLGVSIGATLGVRIGGIILLGYLLVFWLTWLLAERANGLLGGRRLAVVTIKLAGGFTLIALIAWSMMLIWWPWAQLSPIRHPLAALKAMAHFRWPLTVFFDGEFIPGGALPWTYLPVWVLISLPEFYFITVALGFLLAIRLLITGRKSGESEQLIKISLLVLTIVLPTMSALILRPTLYDGLRQFLFILPSASVLAAICFVSFLSSPANKYIKMGAGVAVLISVSLTIVNMVELHPYEYVYFNRVFGGGLRSAAERFETDYWGSSYREGAEWVINNYRPNSAQPIRVAHCGLPFLIRYFFEKTGNLRQRFMVVKPDENPDIYLAITRWQCHKVFEGKVIYTVQRQQTPLLFVIEVKGSYRPEVLTRKAKGFSW